MYAIIRHEQVKGPGLLLHRFITGTLISSDKLCSCLIIAPTVGFDSDQSQRGSILSRSKFFSRPRQHYAHHGQSTRASKHPHHPAGAGALHSRRVRAPGLAEPQLLLRFVHGRKPQRHRIRTRSTIPSRPPLLASPEALIPQPHRERRRSRQVHRPRRLSPDTCQKWCAYLRPPSKETGSSERVASVATIMCLLQGHHHFGIAGGDSEFD